MKKRTEHVATTIDYHERTEHRLPNRYAASLGYLDWKNQPEPFRLYNNTKRIDLPICEPVKGGPPSWDLTRSSLSIEPAVLDIKSISQLLYDSMAISAWKKSGSSKWALRSNPSSGNLHPTEAYLLLGPIDELTSKPALLHYAPKYHGLEVLRLIETDAFERLCHKLTPGAFIVGLSSIVWREAWKYGERAFRYCMHDVGHAMQAIGCAARILGWRVRRIEGLDSNQLDRLLALDNSSGPEAEHADVLLAIEPAPCEIEGAAKLVLSDSLLNDLCPPSRGKPNKLSVDHKVWPRLAKVEEATRDNGSAHGDIDNKRGVRDVESDLKASKVSPAARELVRRRRSAVDFDGHTGMNRQQLYRLAATLMPEITPFLWAAFPHRQRVHPVIFLHRIEGLEPGLAILVRNSADEARLRQSITNFKQWEKLPGCPDELPLYRLMNGDMREIGNAIHCHQEIGGDGAMVVSMIGAFDGELDRFGASSWRYLHWEAGAIGQLLYLEAEAINLSATGIGCFFDEGVHKLLGLRGDDFRMLYGTAVGKAVNDPRIQTLSAYQR